MHATLAEWWAFTWGDLSGTQKGQSWKKWRIRVRFYVNMSYNWSQIRLEIFKGSWNPKLKNSAFLEMSLPVVLRCIGWFSRENFPSIFQWTPGDFWVGPLSTKQLGGCFQWGFLNKCHWGFLGKKPHLGGRLGQLVKCQWCHSKFNKAFVNKHFVNIYCMLL